MNKPVILATGSGRTNRKTYLMALYAREKVADELENIRAEISNITVCD